MRAPPSLVLTLAVSAALALILIAQRPTGTEPIRVGVVHALSGPMAESERGLVDAARLAVEEINAEGGLLGRRLDLIVADSRSNWTTATTEVERLILRERVSVVFACWTSACRKAVTPVVEKHRHLMFYPLQYEGLEESPHLVYMGSTPNQQIIPGTRWTMDRFGTRIYLVGSDYIFPRTVNRMIRDLVTAAGGEILAERYVPMDAVDLDRIAAEIRALAPDAVLNTLNGDANRHFFASLLAENLTDMPVISFSVAEPELWSMRSGQLHAAHYAVWGYFQSLPDPANRRFVDAFRKRFGAERVVSDPIVSSYNGVRLWAEAVRAAGTDDPAQINRSVGHTSLDGPSGIVALDAATRHLWRRVYVGHARADGQFDAVEISEAPIRPVPFPASRSRAEWLALVDRLSGETNRSLPRDSRWAP
jgi:urea transport system substrate-binding protein